MNKETSTQEPTSHQQTNEQSHQAKEAHLQSQLSKIAYSHLIFNPNKRLLVVARHLKEIFDAVSFVTRLNQNIRNLVSATATTRQLNLGPKQSQPRKTLFVDLDETLVRTEQQEREGFTESFQIGNVRFWFAVRPYACQFLLKMTSHYEIVLFTTAEDEYARHFYKLFNERTKGTLSGVLSRQHCIHLYKNIFFKDLTVVADRQLKNMVLLDNSVISFGFNIDNGVPIVSFTGEAEDSELLHISDYLVNLSQVDDVRCANRQHLNLKGITNVTADNMIAS